MQFISGNPAFSVDLRWPKNELDRQQYQSNPLLCLIVDKVQKKRKQGTQLDLGPVNLNSIESLGLFLFFFWTKQTMKVKQLKKKERFEGENSIT